MRELKIKITKCTECPYIKQQTFSDGSGHHHCTHPDTEGRIGRLDTFYMAKGSPNWTHLKVAEWCPLDEIKDVE